MFRLWRSNLITFKNATFTACVQTLFAFLLLGVAQFIQGITYKDPANSSYTPSPTSDKTTYTIIIQEVFFILGILFSTLSALTIALVWMEVAEKAKKFLRASPETMIPWTRRFLLVFEVVIACGMVASIATSQSHIGVGFGVIAAIVAIFVYIIGFCRLRREIMEINSDSGVKSYRQVMRDIAITAFGALLSLFGVIINSIYIVVHTNWKNYALPNMIPGVVVAWQLIVTFLILMDCFVLASLFKTTKKYLENFQTSQNSAIGTLVDGSYKGKEDDKSSAQVNNIT